MANKGKNKHRQITCFDQIHQKVLSLDSNEEVDTLAWLTEACNLSIINDFDYQPPAFNLFESIKYQDIYNKTKTLFREHSYTPDWLLSFTPSAYLELAKEFKIDYSELSNCNCSVYIDSKGTFNVTERAFGYNQKWVWQKFKKYIYKLVPKVFFKKFGVPKASLYTNKTKKPRKMFQGFQLISEVFSSDK